MHIESIYLDLCGINGWPGYAFISFMHTKWCDIKMDNKNRPYNFPTTYPALNAERFNNKNFSTHRIFYSHIFGIRQIRAQMRSLNHRTNPNPIPITSKHIGNLRCNI